MQTLPFVYSEKLLPGYVRDDRLLNSACYLCGTTVPPLEEEHVIPKVVFRSIQPSNYLKLRACGPCNRAKGRDDEYMGQFLAATTFNEHAQFGIDKAHDALAKNKGVGIFQDINSRVKPLPDDYEGLPLSRYTVQAAPGRIESFLEAIAKGLWTTYGNQIFDWSQYHFKSNAEQIPMDGEMLYSEPWASLRQHAHYKANWEGVCSYEGLIIDSRASMWLITFYNFQAYYVVGQLKSLQHLDVAEELGLD